MLNCPKDNVFYRNLHWHYPTVIKGEGIYLFTSDGRRFIDGCSGSAVANLGHGNIEIASAIAKQASTIAFTHLSRFTTEAIQGLANETAKLTPGDLNKSYFVSGGSEATETAIKLSRQYFLERDGHSEKYKVIARKNSFHGNTLGALSMTGHAARRRPYLPYLAEFPHIEAPYCYRCPYNLQYPDCDTKCAYALEAEIQKQDPYKVAAFIAEPIVGSACPGMHPPLEYFQIVKEICEKHDILLIIDEVMSGFGRTGKNFGIDHYQIVPDIITAAKGMSCGYAPLGAAIVSEKIFEVFAHGSGHFVHGHTYGGNPLSCQTGRVVLEIIQREGYIENADQQGKYLYSCLKQLYSYPIVGDIRGKGLMIGIEFVKNQTTKEPFSPIQDVRNKVMLNCMEAGLVVYPGGGSVDGTLGDHILLTPPLTVTASEVDKIVKYLTQAIEKTCKELFKGAN